jgi:hypothetical protein
LAIFHIAYHNDFKEKVFETFGIKAVLRPWNNNDFPSEALRQLDTIKRLTWLRLWQLAGAKGEDMRYYVNLHFPKEK